jgi:hypothetical protein
MKKDPLKLSLARRQPLLLWCAYDPFQWHLIDGVNLRSTKLGI